MRPLHRILSLAAAAFLSATALPAQHFISGGTASAFNNFGGGYGGYSGVGSIGGWGYGWGGDWGGGWGFEGIHHPQEHAPFGVTMAHGDADFEPSQFMDYNEAVALGKKILEEEAAPKPSLGEIARRFRARRTIQPPAPPPLLQKRRWLPKGS